MQSTSINIDEFVKNVARNLNRFTGKAEYIPTSRTIVTYSQGQSLEAKIHLHNVPSADDILYSIEIDNSEFVGPIHKLSTDDFQDHILCTVMSKLGDKVMNALLK